MVGERGVSRRGAVPDGVARQVKRSHGGSAWKPEERDALSRARGGRERSRQGGRKQAGEG